MSCNSINKDFDPFDIDFHYIDNDEDNIMRLKENLIANNIKEPNFYYYKLLKMIKPENEISSNYSEKKKNALKTEKMSKIIESEQIDETKINLFFVLYNGCDYNDEYKEIIIDRNIKAKRLIIQDYSIKNEKIELGKKQYRYKKIFNEKENNIFFNDGQNEIIVEKQKEKKGKRETIMFLNEEELLSEKKFMAKNPTVKNIKDDLTLLNSKSGNKSQSVKNTNIKTNDNSSKESVNNIEYNTISMPSHENLTNTSESKEFDDSEKEVRGERFYSENKRYIFTDIYSKEIDGVFTKNNQINLEKSKIDIMTGLGDLILKYDDKNDIQSHIIYKNFDEPYINVNTPFIIEVKKSLNSLISLLNQIKNISKVVGNLYGQQLPTLIIGIVCRFTPDQVNVQKNLLESNKGNETLLQHIMNIINGNKVHVVIGVIKDEKILDYPLGESDYNIEGENLETRIDIYYMNTRFKNLDNGVMQSIYTKYSKIYKSITFLSNPIQNFDNLLKKTKEMELKIIKMEKEKKEYEDMKLKMEKEKKEYEEMKRKEYEDMKLKMEKEKKEYEDMKLKMEKEKKEYEEMKRKEYEDMKLKMEKEKKEYEDMKLKMEKEKKEYEDMKLKMENERKDKDAIEEKNGDN